MNLTRAGRIGVAACLLLFALGAGTALGHSQLVSSSPGAGQVVPTSPSQLRLVFSEPIEGRYTSLNLLDANGTLLLAGVGSVDPTDPNALVESLTTPLPDGAYTISWQAVSASDGHNTSGFLTFAVGKASLPAGTTETGSAAGQLHAGHGGASASLEVFAKTLGYGGAMLVFGLWVVGALVLRPVRGRWPPGLLLGQLGALLATAGESDLAGRPWACPSFKKCATSSGMSATRSRNAGMRSRTTLRRKYRSSRNDPARTACVKSRLVAVTRRTSTGSSRSAPTGRMRRLSSTRSSFACIGAGISEISSRKSVPPRAAQNKPSRA